MKRLLLVLFAATVALGATTLHLVRTLRAERATTEQLQARVAELERAAAAAARMSPFASIPEPTPEQAAPEPASAAPPAPSAAAASRPAPPPRMFAMTPEVRPGAPSREEHIRMMRESIERQRALLRDPEYREALMAQQKAMLPHMYPDLAQELGLTPEESDALMTVLADHQIRSMENSRFAFDGPPTPEQMNELQRKAQEERERHDREIRRVLGEEKWRAWQEYQSTMGVRHQVRELKTTLEMNGVPLMDYQVKPLQRALADMQRQQMEELSRGGPIAAMVRPGGAPANPLSQIELMEAQIQRQREHNARTRDALASILTPEQLQHFEAQQDAQLKMQEAHLRLMRAQGAASQALESNALAPMAAPALYAVGGNVVTLQEGPARE